MAFLRAAMRDPRFLCPAIVVTAVLAMLSDVASERIALHLWDAADVLLVVFVVMYLRVAEPSEMRTGIKAMLIGVVMLLVVMYTVVG